MHDVERIVDQFRALGITDGDTVLVHSSLRSLGPVQGGAATVLGALRRAVGRAAGTVVVPAFTPDNSDTSDQYRKATAGMTADEVREYRAAMPPFRAATTPASPVVGALAEVLRLCPGSHRSAHPISSFAALGRHAAVVTAHHDPTCHFGERSPLARLYALPQAKILMLGTGFAACSAFHLAEYRGPARRQRIYRCVVPGADGRGEWWSHGDIDLDGGDFAEIGAAYSAGAAESPSTGPVGDATATIVPFAPAVDFAVRWMNGRQGSEPGAHFAGKALTGERTSR
ncbi:aminoglycoside N(3)-acetyltransferase [Yinghuangia soli]|uniref:Aminoglycoside N(3)-acetyltransferase n=1 Tax=Yinghuangia soli TaxID=2908204 RepID=A0AA41TYZ5_9ACTN|nr:AAC(3) family N-acetyltransferase [Yinghuangia soli]MCF2526710.1 AAC(3) family N-acetyltransferase [Yinghuangia soli]